MVAILNSFAQICPEPFERFLAFADRHSLGGTGIGFVDANLLATAAAADAVLWTRDKRLAAQAGRLGLAYRPA